MKKIKFVSTVFAFGFLTFTAQAKILVLKPISTQTEMANWQTDLAARAEDLKRQGNYPQEGYAECRETKELVGTFFCLFPTQVEMNEAFGRASIFVEGDNGIPTGQIVPLDNPVFIADNTKILGHDLKRDDLIDFMKAADQACKDSHQDRNICYSKTEKDLIKNFIRPRALGISNFIVIAAPLEPAKEIDATITHEMSHAQFFNQPVFQKVVHQFWTEQVSESDRAAMIAILAEGYDVNDLELVENEFQAYMLESAAFTSDLHDFAPIYRAKLIEALTAAGVPPIFAKNN